MTPEEQNLRNVILLMLKGVKVYRARAMTAGALMGWLLHLPPNKRAALTEVEVQRKADEFRLLAEAEAQERAAAVEAAVTSGADFLPALQWYASRLLDS